MVVHKFICDSCGTVVKDTNTKCAHKCKNGCGDMRWDLGGIGIPAGDYEHISDSLAIHPEQISEHRKLFPNIDVLPDGRPRFTSPKQQEKYAERCGFYKKRQKKKLKGKRIA